MGVTLAPRHQWSLSFELVTRPILLYRAVSALCGLGRAQPQRSNIAWPPCRASSLAGRSPPSSRCSAAPCAPRPRPLRARFGPSMNGRLRS